MQKIIIFLMFAHLIGCTSKPPFHTLRELNFDSLIRHDSLQKDLIKYIRTCSLKDSEYTDVDGSGVLIASPTFFSGFPGTLSVEMDKTFRRKLITWDPEQPNYPLQISGVLNHTFPSSKIIIADDSIFQEGLQHEYHSGWSHLQIYDSLQKRMASILATFDKSRMSIPKLILTPIGSDTVVAVIFISRY